MKTLLKLLPTSLVHKITNYKIRNYHKFERFFLEQKPETIEILQEKYLLYTFHQFAQRVPLYRTFLKSHKIDSASITTVQDFLEKVPETTKKNYIFAAQKLAQLCLDGDYHNINLLVKSSGHSGRQCYWAQSHMTDAFSETVLSIGLDRNFHINSTKTLILNGFILGSWVTGITFNEYASSHCTVLNIGPKVDEILQTMQEIGKEYQQILITGYPPFIKELVDTGKAQKFPWKHFRVHFAAGGEDFPESWREYIMKQSGAKKIRSGFGASDIGILGGVETDASVHIRQKAEKNPILKKALFGNVQETPMLFQYPTNLFINTNSKGQLVFTTILPEAIQPVIKYNLEDLGGVIPYRTMEKILEEQGMEITAELPLPFFYVIGRADGPVNFHAFLIYPENIEDCLYKNKAVAGAVTGNFRLSKKHDDHHEPSLVVELQLKKKVKKSKTMEQHFQKLFAETLAKVNQGYRETQERIGNRALPFIVLYEFAEYPHQSKIKNVYT